MPDAEHASAILTSRHGGSWNRVAAEAAAVSAAAAATENNDDTECAEEDETPDSHLKGTQSNTECGEKYCYLFSSAVTFCHIRG